MNEANIKLNDPKSEISENMHTIGLEAEESEILDDEQERMKREQTEIENMISSDDGMVTFDNEYISRIVDNELENILNGFAEKKVFSALEDELSNSLINEAKQIDYGNIHKNAHVNIHRQKYLNDNDLDVENASPKIYGEMALFAFDVPEHTSSSFSTTTVERL